MSDLTWSGPQACRVAGITYRQLDYWCRRGLVTPSRPAQGSGTERGYTAGEIVELRVLAALCDLEPGTRSPGTALYRLLDGRSSTTWGPVTVTVDRAAVAAEVHARLAVIPPQRPWRSPPAAPPCRMPPQLARPAASA